MVGLEGLAELVEWAELAQEESEASGAGEEALELRGSLNSCCRFWSDRCCTAPLFHRNCHS